MTTGERCRAARQQSRRAQRRGAPLRLRAATVGFDRARSVRFGPPLQPGPQDIDGDAVLGMHHHHRSELGRPLHRSKSFPSSLYQAPAMKYLKLVMPSCITASISASGAPWMSPIAR